MRTVTLGELGEIVSGSTPKTGISEFWTGDIPWVTPADLSDHEGIYFRGKPKRISKAGFDSCSTSMLPAGSILFSSRAPIGHCAVTTYPLCTNQGFKNIIPNRRLNAAYGYYALRFITPAIVALGRGATFAEINKEIIESVEIPYCDLPEQQRIAAQLEQADRLRRTRRYALEISDTFLPAAFLEIFGDPRKNTKDFRRAYLGDVASIQGGFAFKSQDYATRGVRLVKITNVHFENLQWHEAEFLPEHYLNDYKNFALREGDLLVALTRPIIQSLNTVKVAKVAKSDLPCLLNQRVGRFVIKSPEELSTTYLQHFCYTAYFKERVDFFCSESLQPNVSTEQLEEIQTILPPQSLQQAFTALVERVDRLRAVQREALRQAEHLFATLLHRAFAGGI